MGAQERKNSWISTFASWGKSKNLRVFSLCFVAALLFWGLNALNKDYQTNINMPLVVVYNDSSLIPLDPPPREIPLRVSGYGWDLIRWTFGWKIDPIKLEPEGLPESDVLTFNNYSENITAKLEDLKLVNYLDAQAALNFDYLESKKVPITFDTTQIPFEEEFYLKPGINIVPDSLIFTGPKSLLDHLQDHYTLVLPEEKINKDFNSSISIQFPHSGLVTVVPEEISIRFPVGEWTRLEKEFPVSIYKKGKISEDHRTTPSSVKVLFRLPEGYNIDSRFDSIKAYTEINKMKKGDSLFPVILDRIPKGAENYTLVPDTLIIKKNEST